MKFSGATMSYPFSIRNSGCPWRTKRSKPSGSGKSCRQQKKAQKECGVLLYEDEVLFRQPGSIYRHWARRGIGSQVKSFPGRTSIKVIGSVSKGTSPKFHFRSVAVFNSDTYLESLKQLVRQYKGCRIHLIADNAKWNMSPPVLEWMQSNKVKIELHFLAKYPPDLNAAEWVWKETRRWATHNRFFPKEAMLKERLFRRIQPVPGLSSILEISDCPIGLKTDFNAQQFYDDLRKVVGRDDGLALFREADRNPC
jgi:transposase